MLADRYEDLAEADEARVADLVGDHRDRDLVAALIRDVERIAERGPLPIGEHLVAVTRRWGAVAAWKLAFLRDLAADLLERAGGPPTLGQ